MKEIVKLGLILFVICLVSAALLGFVDQLTAETINQQREMKSEELRKQVLPIAGEFKILDEAKMSEIIAKNPKVLEVFEGIKDGQVVGYIVKTNPSGYSGPVEITTGISLEGKVLGMRVGKHAETPGLGANATLPYFYEQYNEQSIEKPLTVIKSGTPKEGEILAISGSTITTNCVTLGVNFSIDVVKSLTE